MLLSLEALPAVCTEHHLLGLFRNIMGFEYNGLWYGIAEVIEVVLHVLIS
jgi:hypothetical protein